MAPYITNIESESLPVNGVPVIDNTHISNHADPKPNKTTPRPIAICGMALRLPGGITTPSQFWDFLVSKKDARGPVPATRYNIAGFHSKSGKSNAIKTNHGYFLDESIDLGALDTTFFNMPKNEVERQDPQQRQLLEVTRECLDSAGEVNYRGKDVGCYIGSFGEDWVEAFAKDDQHHGTYRISGYSDFALANRLSYEFDLQGPSMVIRAACSSSLIALHQACLAIDRGECTSAIVGGASLITGPGQTAAMSEQGVLSPNGSCRTFDADADGYARAEAINAIFIKPLDDAIRDRNPIRAIIRSTASNCDGKTPSLFLPSTESHEAMIRKAYTSAGLDFTETPFCELHGTGTPIGDPLEAAAVANVFGDNGVYIGSVKPNVGHSEAASGITSLIKAVLAIEHRIIPPNIKFDKPNPRIPFESRKLIVPVEPTPWPKDRAVRVSVNSFGIGGSNAHAIVESASNFLPQKPAKTLKLNERHLLLFSANTAGSLQSQVSNLQQYAEEHPELLPDMAYTLAVRREHLPHRAYSIFAKGETTITAPAVKSSSTSALLVMIFTGQGAHWPQMGLELFKSQPTFRKCIQKLDQVLQALPDAPGWLIEEELQKTPDTSNLSQAAYSQPLCTAVQIALVENLTALGIRPAGVVGHSSGEMAAAFAAGKLTSSEAIIAAYYRGIVSGNITRHGKMAAIGMGWDETSGFLIDGVVIACENSPSSVTISGDEAPLDEVLTSIRAARPDVLARALKIDRAYHSHHMKEVGETYRQLTERRVFGNKPNPSVLFFSSVSGKQIHPSDSVGPNYWQSNLESPVRFRTAVTNLVHALETKYIKRKSKNLVFLEIGPHSALAGPLRQILTAASLSSPYIPAMIRKKDCTETFLSSIGQLYLQNVSVDFKALTDPLDSATALPDLPTYSWHHDKSFWYETRVMKEWRHRKYKHHELLGSRVPESTDNEPAWRSILSLDKTPWVRDHNIKNDVIFPCAGYVGMIAEVARQLSLSSQHSDGKFHGYTLRQVVVSTALVLDESKTTEIITQLTRQRLTDSLDSEWFDFTISSHNGVSWIKHCSGQVCATNESVENHGKPSPLPREVNSARFYDSMRRVGANYGPCFQGLRDITSATTSNTAFAHTTNTITGDDKDYLVHPTAFDNFLQL
ncbi:hypothetical protein G7Y89_g10264 [Cudoniella acicularis]|uniref:Polyketide synthase n=1 Tax=Cudoniella acicularis TaxID=354080 RepID=A0A8H4RE67_9HELO|nr:hypothetical protein G7Y89_g10264 [Cudoniella acicularis]